MTILNGMDDEKYLDEHCRSALQRVERYSGSPNLLRSRVAVPDSGYRERPTVQEIREHCSAMAAVKGRRWYAEMLLNAQEFPNRHVANRTLIQTSRRLLAESRGRILRTKNILAFHRPTNEYVS